MNVIEERATTRRALDYAAATIASRAITFVGLLIAAATLTKGNYARFALAYQIALFISYLVAPPLAVAGFRLQAGDQEPLLRLRVVAGGLAGFACAGVVAIVLVPDAGTAVFVSTAAFGAAAVVASVAMAQASADYYATTFARWSAAGSLLFPIGILLAPRVTVALAAAAVAILVAPVALVPQMRHRLAPAASRGLRRLPVSVFVWNLAYNLSFVLLLAVAANALSGAQADRAALMLTFVQAAVVVPAQFALVVQPQLVRDTEAGFRALYSRTQAALALACMLGAFIGAGVVVAAGTIDWLPIAMMIASVLPLAFGLLGGYGLNLADGAGLRFVASPVAMLAALGALTALPLGRMDDSRLAAAWLAAAVVGALAQSLNSAWTHLARPLGLGLAAAGACIAAGLVHPILGAVVAALVLVIVRRSIARALVAARQIVAAHR